MGNNTEDYFNNQKKFVEQTQKTIQQALKNVNKMMPKGETKIVKIAGKKAKVYLGENDLMYIEFLNKKDGKIFFDSLK